MWWESALGALTLSSEIQVSGSSVQMDSTQHTHTRKSKSNHGLHWRLRIIQFGSNQKTCTCAIVCIKTNLRISIRSSRRTRRFWSVFFLILTNEQLIKRRRCPKHDVYVPITTQHVNSFRSTPTFCYAFGQLLRSVWQTAITFKTSLCDSSLRCFNY